MPTAQVDADRHPERTLIYRVLFHHIDSFLQEYESRFERDYGYLRHIVEEMVYKYLDCGNPKFGFVRIKCSDCGTEKLRMFPARPVDSPNAHLLPKLSLIWQLRKEELLVDSICFFYVFLLMKQLKG